LLLFDANDDDDGAVATAIALPTCPALLLLFIAKIAEDVEAAVATALLLSVLSFLDDDALGAVTAVAATTLLLLLLFVANDDDDGDVKDKASCKSNVA
jgi:hypothetical protein